MAGAVFLMNIVIITIHELGHAIIYVIMTGNRVGIFLGSYADEQKSKKITIGRYDIWVRTNIFKWKGGLCVPYSRQPLSPKADFRFTLAGPMASLLLASVVGAVLLIYRPQGIAGAFFTVFFAWSAMVFLYNIVPRERAIVTQSGGITYNDGYQLKRILSDKKMPVSYKEAVVLFREKKYDDAATQLEQALATGTKDPEVYRLAINTHIKLKNYRYANQIQKQQIQKIGNLNTTDRVNLALLKTFLGNYDEAIAYYKHLLQKDGLNRYNLNNLGYTLTLTGQYEEAIPYLDQAIEMNKDFAYAYSNRAYAKMKMGHWEDGKSDNDISLGLDDDNAHAYRNSGLYHFEMAQYEDALTAFEKVRAIDPSFDSINRYISDTEWHVSQKNLPEEEG